MILPPGGSRTFGERLLVITPSTITPLLAAELLVEGERWPICVAEKGVM